MGKKKTAIVIGSGAGGAVMAKELQGAYKVTILEAGGDFKPFAGPVGKLAELRRTGLFLDERLIRLLIPNMMIDKNASIAVARGIGVGGTTPLATGNAVRADDALRAIGIDLDREFEELYRELPITTEHRAGWSEAMETLYRAFEEEGLAPAVTPKLLDPGKCIHCGHCAIGCPPDAKWDCRVLVDEAVAAGARLIKGCRVTDLEIRDHKVTAVHAKMRGRRVSLHADLVVLAAGGLGTPVILQKSGIACKDSLFVDPVLCVAGPLPGFGQDKDLLMAFISRQDGYILSPYIDYLSFFFNKKWRYPMDGIASIMIKLGDEETGSLDGRQMQKRLTQKDIATLKKAVAQCRRVLTRIGIPREKQFLGTLNAGHPGGMLPLTPADRDTLHPGVLPDNLYVADATILPAAPGNPPMLTIMALAKKIAGMVK